MNFSFSSLSRWFGGEAGSPAHSFQPEMSVARPALRSRRDKILHGLDLGKSIGAEIGPLDKALVGKSEGQIIYVDHCDAQTLRTKYATDTYVDLSKLHVDAIWGEQTLREAISQFWKEQGGAAPVDCDYVIASHVVEHVPDMVSWLREVHAVLKPDGQLRLAVPDRRFSFDYLRQPTTLAGIVNAYARQDRVPNTHCILDFMLNMAPVDCATAWRGELDPSKLKRRATFDGAMAVVRDAIANGTYHDVHCWVFTPASFAQLCAELAQNGLLDFECSEFFDTARNEFEFIVSMQKCSDTNRIVESWRRMAAACRDFDPAARVSRSN